MILNKVLEISTIIMIYTRHQHNHHEFNTIMIIITIVDTILRPYKDLSFEKNT